MRMQHVDLSLVDDSSVLFVETDRGTLKITIDREQDHGNVLISQIDEDAGTESPAIPASLAYLKVGAPVCVASENPELEDLTVRKIELFYE